MKKERTNQIGIICGNRGVGKSTFILEGCKKHNKKVLIFDLDDNHLYHQFQKITPEVLPHWKKGIKRMIDSDIDQVLESMVKYIYNTLIIFEDATKYVEANIPKTIQQLVLASKQRNLDIVFTFHTIRSLPPKLLSWTNYLVLFKTYESIKQFRKKIPLYEQVEKAHKEVENHKSQYFNKTIRLQ